MREEGKEGERGVVGGGRRKREKEEEGGGQEGEGVFVSQERD